MSTILDVANLNTFYGKSHILHGVSMRVDEGEIVTMLGRNGAGKTTTMRSVMGLTPARSGKITLFGEDASRWPPHRIAKAGVGYVPEGRKIFKHLTVHENLQVPASRQGRWSLTNIYELFPRLGERRLSKGGNLSGGEQEMLAIARALLLNPDFLILDEPSQGLAPMIVDDVMQTIASMREEGIAVLLVEQNAWLALSKADRVYVLADGKVVHAGDAQELAQDSDKVKALAGAGLEESAAAAM